jgi:glycosyltransferase involved in cell wall biosynthesis
VAPPRPVRVRAVTTVAVDLTPVLPGGENGGAKGFALALVAHLAAHAPAASFVVLTQAASHDELSRLDSANVRRVQVVGAAASRARSGLFGSATLALSRLPARPRASLAALGYRANARLKRSGARGLLRREAADVLLCPFTAPTFRVPGIPTVCTVYDRQYRAYPQFFAIEDAVLRECAYADACRHGNALAAISDFTRGEALEDGSVAPARISTIALRLARRLAPSPADEGTLARLGLEAGRYLLYPANFWRHKNHEMLLDAFAIARARGLDPAMKLVCTGEPGARQAWLAEAARRMGLDAMMSFPGFLAQAELDALLARAAGLVFPSLYEGFGLPVAEAMAAGIPVACGDRTALPEVAGGAALLFDPRRPAAIADAMIAITRDEALRARLVADGLKRAEAFLDGERMAREYWALIESIASPS